VRELSAESARLIESVLFGQAISGAKGTLELAGIGGGRKLHELDALREVWSDRNRVFSGRCSWKENAGTVWHLWTSVSGQFAYRSSHQAASPLLEVREDRYKRNVMPMCALAVMICTKGYIDGKVTVNKAKMGLATAALNYYLKNLKGRICSYWPERNVLRWHREYHEELDNGRVEDGCPQNI